VRQGYGEEAKDVGTDGDAWFERTTNHQTDGLPEDDG